MKKNLSAFSKSIENSVVRNVDDLGKIKIFMPVNKVKMRFFKFDDAWSSGWNETDCMIAKDRSCLEVSVERKKKEKNVWTHRRFLSRFCLEKTKWPLTIFYIIKMFRSGKKTRQND